MIPLNLYSVVKARRALSDLVVEDSIGTILMIYDADTFEVEFMSETGESLDVLTVSSADIVEFNLSE